MIRKDPRHKIKILSQKEEKEFKNVLRKSIIQISRDQDKLTGTNCTDPILLRGDNLEEKVEREFIMRTTTKCPTCKGFKEFHEQTCKSCDEHFSSIGTHMLRNASKDYKAKWLALRRKWEGDNFTDKELDDLIKDWDLEI